MKTKTNDYYVYVYSHPDTRQPNSAPHPAVIQAAQLLGRTPGSLGRKMGRR